jgi:hypothetical protein
MVASPLRIHPAALDPTVQMLEQRLIQAQRMTGYRGLTLALLCLLTGLCVGLAVGLVLDWTLI